MAGLKVKGSASNVSQLISDIDCKIKGLLADFLPRCSNAAAKL